MKKFVKALFFPFLLISLFSCTSNYNSADSFEEYNYDLLNESSICVSRLSTLNIKTEIGLPYVQVSTDTPNMIRFATPVCIGTDLETLTFVRDINGSLKELNITKVYKSFKGGNGNSYYYVPGEGLTTTNPNNDYYFACYTIAYNSAEYESTDIKGYLTCNTGLNSMFTICSFDDVNATSKNIVTYTLDDNLIGREIVASGEVASYPSRAKYKEEDNEYSYDIYNDSTKYDITSTVNSNLNLTLKKDPYIHFNRIGYCNDESFVIYYTAWDGYNKVHINKGSNFSATSEGFVINQYDSVHDVWYVEVNTENNYLRFIFQESFANGETYFIRKNSTYKLTDTVSIVFEDEYKFTKTETSWEFEQIDPLNLFEFGDVIYSTSSLICISVPFSGTCSDFLKDATFVNWLEDGDFDLGYGSLQGEEDNRYLQIVFNKTASTGTKYKLLKGLTITTNDEVVHTLKNDTSFTYYADAWHISKENDDYLYDLTSSKITSSNYESITFEVDTSFSKSTLSLSSGYKYNDVNYTFSSITYSYGTVTLKLNEKANNLDCITITEGSSLSDGKHNLIFAEDESISYCRTTRTWCLTTDIDENYGKEFVSFADLPGDQSNSQVINYYKDLNLNTMVMTNDYVGGLDSNMSLVLDSTNQYANYLDTLADNNINIWIRNQNNLNNFFDNVGTSLSEHPYITGYYMADEPFENNTLATNSSVSQPGVAFDQYDKLINWKNTYASNEYFYMNMVPSSSYNHWESNKRDDYGSFLDSYIEEMIEPLNGPGKANLGLDHYPYLNSNDIDDYYLWDLLTAANKVRDYNASKDLDKVELEYSMCIQSSNPDDTKLRNINSTKEISFQINLGIALGARIFEYFAFETNESFGVYDAMVTKDTSSSFSKGNCYEYVKEANANYMPFGPIMSDYSWKGLIKGSSGSHGSSLTEINRCNSLFISASNTNSLYEHYSLGKDFVIGAFENSDSEEGFYITNYGDPVNDQETESTILLRFQNQNYAETSSGLNFTKVKVYSATGTSAIYDLSDGLMSYKLAAGEGIFVIPLE